MINEMPIAIDICRIDDGDGIGSTLVRHKAGNHESCKLKFNNSKLLRVQKKHGKLKDTDPSDTGVSLLEVQQSQTRVHLHRK